MQPFVAAFLLAWFGQATPAPESLVRTFVDTDGKIANVWYFAAHRC